MSWKYVMFQDKHGRQFPVIFPQELVHAEIAHAIPSAYRSGELKEGKRDWDCPKAVSAGFIEGLTITHACRESESLDMKARKEDRRIINNHPYEKGIETAMSESTEVLIIIKSAENLIDLAKEIGG